MASGGGIDCEQLIEAVRSFPCLWEVGSRDYKDSRARDNAWKCILERVGGSPKVCSKKWKNVRDKYVRELKKIKKKKKKKTGKEGPPPNCSWVYFPLLSFLKSSMKHRP